MNSKTNIRNAFHEVKYQVKVEEVASRLGAKLTQQGTSFVGTCPTGHSSSSNKSFHIDSRQQLFHCWNCGIGGDVISLVEQVKHLSKLDSLKWLVKEYNLKDDLSKNFHIPKPTPEEIKKKQEMEVRHLIFSRIVEIGKEKLYEEEGTEALKYLTDVRGYKIEKLKETEWFYLPEAYDIKKMLIEENEEWKESVRSLKLQGHFGDNFRLAFPYRNEEGIITGFLKRSQNPNGITVTTYDGKEHNGVRWDSTPGLNKDDLFGLDKVDNIVDTLIVVEGYPDAIYLRACGIENIVAVGQGKLGIKHLEALRRRKIKNMIISFDNDGVGPENTEEAVMMLLEKTRITPYVIDPGEYGIHKDPDEFFKANGIDQLKKIFNDKPVHGASWVVKGLLRGKEEANPIEKNNLKDHILELLHLIKDESVAQSILNDPVQPFFNEKISELKKQLKAKRKDYKDDLAGHINNDAIIPFLDDNSVSRCYYDRQKDELKIGIDKETIMELMLDFGLTAPENYPRFTVKFDPQDLGGKFDTYSKTFNLFTPTKYMFQQKNDDNIDIPKECPAIFSVISNVIPVPDEREKFINWLSYTFSTRKKSIVAWLFRGTQGTGKNLMFEEIITPLWGENHCTVVGNSALDSQFNPHMKHKMMIAYNEVTTDNKRDKKDKESKIKTYVSDKKVNINEKNIREYTLDNHSNSFFFSNYEVPIIIEEDDRRFNVVESNRKLRENSYYKQFKHTQFLNKIKEELERFAQYLLNYAYEATAANTEFTNEAKEKIIGSSMSMFEVFARKLKEGDVEWLEDESDSFLHPNWNLETVKEGYILKDVAVEVFNTIFNQNFKSHALSLKLQHYGIEINKKKVVEGNRYRVYLW